MSKHQTCLSLLIAVYVGCSSTGCTLVISAVAGVDNALTPEWDTLEVAHVTKLKADDSVSVTPDEGCDLSGRFVGLGKTRPEEYQVSYAAWQSSDTGRSFPSFDENVVAVRSSPLRPDIHGRFRGFDPGVLYLQSTDETLKIDPGELHRLVGEERRTITGRRLKSWIDAGGVPFYAALLVVADTDSQRVALSSVRDIRKYNPRCQQLKSIPFGLLFDLAIVLGLSCSLGGM